MNTLRKRISSSQIIILSFGFIIFLGTLLLMLPFSSRSGECTPFLDALFTATSAVCVTGLVVQDTATYWTRFGQTVILLLIQIGGMGVVTLSVGFYLASGKRISLKQRSTMQEAISAHKVGGIIRLTGFILRMTFFLECAGAAVMAPVFCREYGMPTGLWYAVFHSVSAFCNAGFDLMGGREKFSSLTHYATDPAVNVTVMALIIIGGIGFMTWDDIRQHRLHFRQYQMQSKVIITTTALLLCLPAIYFFFFEFCTFPMKERIWLSLFQSVTPRTAGFNTADMTQLSETGSALVILLMLIGGSPGSTAGGMKTTTFAVLLSTMISVFRQKEHTHFFGRRITEEAIRKAVTIFTMYLILFLLGGSMISRIEHLPLLYCLYEAASAIGTVGLTLGITPGLGAVSKVLLVLLMYTGRVGALTLVFSAVNNTRSSTLRLPNEKITVG